MTQSRFEYFQKGGQGHIFEADTFEGAVRETRILNNGTGITWAGLIGMAGDREFLGSVKVTESDIAFYGPDDEY